ncbi:MAG TPA: transglycosylase [Gammaproteobacteria bacterium]|nr:transglycosylase [Gammaproteobacteria bacterium]
MHTWLTGTVLIFMLLLTPLSLANTYDAEREQFLRAEAALKAGDRKTFEQLSQQLGDYPLHGYLEYWQLRRRLGKAKAGEVQDFLDRYDGQPVATRLRASWLHKLGKRRDWDTYLEFYRPQTASVTLQCYDVRARLAKGDRKQALKDTLALWLVGTSRPDACDPAFDQLYASSLLTSARIWERVRLAFANQKSSLAVYLAKRLSAKDREWVKRWQYAHRRPTAALAKDWAGQDTPLVREILVHALRRLARHKPGQAWKHWQQVSKTHRFSHGQTGSVLQAIALHGALRRDPQAAEWLQAVPADAADTDIRQWRVRTALGNEDWDAVLHWIDELTPTERQADNWRYWKAYALDKKGETGDAYTEFARLSGERSYYGFLAADRLQRPYQMNDARLEHKPSQLDTVEQIPGIVRARELYLAGKHMEARREWFHTTGSLPQSQLKLAALLAHRWGWHDRAILTASRAGYWSDLTLRFPLPHRESIFAWASQYDLDPALIYGVIRQESAFMEDARSPVGALGLMQLMPATGKRTARALKIRYRGSQALLHSDQNIRLGSAYLNRLLQRFNGSPVLAAAAYNAGPHRVSRWLPGEHSVPASLWAERIPFRETRSYVRRVLAYATVFEWRLGRPLTRLSERMPAIQQRY